MTKDQETIDKLVILCCKKNLFNVDSAIGCYCTLVPSDYKLIGRVCCEHLNDDSRIRVGLDMYYRCEKK